MTLALKTMRLRMSGAMIAGLMLAMPAQGQQAPAPQMPAVQTPATQAPAAPSPQTQAPVAPPPTSAPAETAKPLEAPKPLETPKPAADAGGGEMREITARPVLRIKGQSTWDDGFNALKKALAALDAEAKRLNLPREGNSMTYFVDSDDTGFTYEAMLPLGAAPPAGLAFGKDFDAAISPGGRAVVFSHEGAYDEIDTAYEALTAWLDDKGLVSTGKFLEEYEIVPEKSDETTLKLKIVVFLK